METEKKMENLFPSETLTDSKSISDITFFNSAHKEDSPYKVSMSKTLADSQKKIVVQPLENELLREQKMKTVDDHPVGSVEGLEARELRKFKEDIKRLPDEQTLEDYEEVPVEGFAAALLAGYGWIEERGIGRNPKGKVKIFEPDGRFAKEGFTVFSSAHKEDSPYKFSTSKTPTDSVTKRVIPPLEDEWLPRLLGTPEHQQKQKRKTLDLPLDDIENPKSEKGGAAASHPVGSVESRQLKKFKEDIRRLPDEQTLED